MANRSVYLWNNSFKKSNRLKKVLLITVFIFCLIQVAKPQGCFFADVVKGCAPLTINITNCEATSPDAQTFYDYGNGDPTPTNVKTYTYNNPGVYTIKQYPNVLGGGPPYVRTNYIVVTAPVKPTFDLDICSGRNITLTITDNLDTDYEVDFGGTVQSHPPFTPIAFSYPDELLKTITITPKTSNCLTESVSFYPITAIVKPDISSVTVNNQHATNGQITIRFNAINNQRYYLQQSVNNNSSYVNIDTLSNLSGVQDLLISNLNTAANQYCYRLVAYDDCNPFVYSEEICSLINTVTSNSVIDQNDISWTAHIPGSLAYDVYKDNGASPITSTLATSYADPAINCGVNYCYTIHSSLALTDLSGNPLQSISASQCVTATSSTIPPTIQNLNSTVNGESIQLNWDAPAATPAKYEIYRSLNGSPLTLYTSYTSPITNNYQDNSVSLPGNEYCYSVSYTNVCLKASNQSNTTCPIVLSVLTDNSSTLTNYLSWTAYTGSWAGGVLGYLVQRLDENNNVVSAVNVGLTQNYTDVINTVDVKIIKYRIQAIPNGPASSIPYSNVVEIKFEGEIHLPNVFTPNGDGNNDFFAAKGKFIKEFKLTVFNRWGEVVYSSNQMENGWNGMYEGTHALADAYAYLVEATDLWGKSIIKRGSVTLLK